MSLPELSADIRVTVNMTGHVRSVHGRPLIVLPYAISTGASRGRRYRVEIDHGPTVTRVVFSLGGQAAIRPPDLIRLNNDQSVGLRLRALPSRRSRRIPGDLSQALEHAGVTLEHLDEPAAQHLVLMVTEARDATIRVQRVHAAVEAVRQASGAGS